MNIGTKFNQKHFFSILKLNNFRLHIGFWLFDDEIECFAALWTNACLKSKIETLKEHPGMPEHCYLE